MKNMIQFATTQPCPFCGSEDVRYVENCLNDDYDRATSQAGNGVFMTIPKSCWECKKCKKKFLKT